MDDVSSALKKPKRRKASGPDEFGNIFYRDYAEHLAPILAPLFFRWLRCGVDPDSFGEANIQCLKNNCRSIAAGPSTYRTSKQRLHTAYQDPSWASQ